MAKLEKVEGIGSVNARKLRKAGVASTNDFLEKASTPKGRKALAKETGLSPKQILLWANHVDLFRVKGVGEEYADLLEAAGVDTVPELGNRNPKNLHALLVEVNQKKKRVRLLPGEKRVNNWVKQAKKLPRKITY